MKATQSFIHEAPGIAACSAVMERSLRPPPRSEVRLNHLMACLEMSSSDALSENDTFVKHPKQNKLHKIINVLQCLGCKLDVNKYSTSIFIQLVNVSLAFGSLGCFVERGLLNY